MNVIYSPLASSACFTSRMYLQRNLSENRELPIDAKMLLSFCFTQRPVRRFIRTIERGCQNANKNKTCTTELGIHSYSFSFNVSTVPEALRTCSNVARFVLIIFAFHPFIRPINTIKHAYIHDTAKRNL